jgi:hypothetical protein
MMSEAMSDAASPTGTAISPEPEPRRVLWVFAVHVAIGTLVFVIIVAPAVGLGLLVDWMVARNHNPVVILAVRWAEYALLLADLTLFLVFLVKTTWRAIKKL